MHQDERFTAPGLGKLSFTGEHHMFSAVLLPTNLHKVIQNSQTVVQDHGAL
jgi:hypothetical protein